MNDDRNKALVRQHVEEFDQNWGSVDLLDKWFSKWFADDCKMHFNGALLDLAAYKEILSAFRSAFTNVRHEIPLLLTDGDFVTAVATIHMKHIGEWEGIAPTGRTVSFADTAVLRVQDGKIAEEWGVADMAGLRQQLEESPQESE